MYTAHHTLPSCNFRSSLRSWRPRSPPSHRRGSRPWWNPCPTRVPEAAEWQAHSSCTEEKSHVQGQPSMYCIAAVHSSIQVLRCSASYYWQPLGSFQDLGPLGHLDNLRDCPSMVIIHGSSDVLLLSPCAQLIQAWNIDDYWEPRLVVGLPRLELLHEGIYLDTSMGFKENT